MCKYIPAGMYLHTTRTRTQYFISRPTNEGFYCILMILSITVRISVWFASIGIPQLVDLPSVLKRDRLIFTQPQFQQTTRTSQVTTQTMQFDYVL